MIDTHTNQIVEAVPLFEHGLSLFCFAGKDDWETMESLDRYVETLMPRTYEDFVTEAKSVMTERHREMLRHLLTFRFKRHPTYNLPAKRLNLIEKQIQKRARLLLE